MLIGEPGAPSNEEITNLAARLRDIAKEVIEHLDSKSTTAIKMKVSNVIFLSSVKVGLKSRLS